MIDIFEKYAPRWRRIVRDYALDVWLGKADDDTRLDYDLAASRFARSYRHALETYYKDKGMNVYRGTLDGKMHEWLKGQQALRESLEITIKERQDELVTSEIEKLRFNKDADAQKMLNKLYDAKKGENVYKVFSFAEHFNDRAEQIGDDNAFELGREINETVIKLYSEIYIWETQRDKRVRGTHKKLRGKCFRFDDPPTTVTKSGKRHTGNPGTDWGCRCYAVIPEKTRKPLRGYVVYENDSRAA